MLFDKAIAFHVQKREGRSLFKSKYINAEKFCTFLNSRVSNYTQDLIKFFAAQDLLTD